MTPKIIPLAAALLAAAALVGPASADPPYSMAPPVQSSPVQSYDNDNSSSYDNNVGYDNGSYDSNGPRSAGADSVFPWAEVPENQQVPIRRAVFDRGGYQLYDTAGETIIVPFANENLYVMKFGISDNGSTYFVNTGSAPVLFLPRGGSLENATVPGARWYPFSEDFRPAQPVFLGIAPSYSDFVGMGWYPDMSAYGGYYSRRPFIAGSVFAPTIGLSFVIGGRSYDGWQPYHRYYDNHPAPYRVSIVNRNIYRNYDRHHDGFYGAGRREDWQRRDRLNNAFGRDHSSDRPFAVHQSDPFRTDGRQGRSNQDWTHRTFSGTRGYNIHSGNSVHDNTHPDNHARVDNNKAFDSARAAQTDHRFVGPRLFPNGQQRFQGGQSGFQRPGNSDDHSFRGNRSPSDNSSSRPVFGGGDRPAFGSGSDQHAAFDGGANRPAFGGGNRRAAFDGGSGRSGQGDGGNKRSGQSDGGRRNASDGNRSGGRDRDGGNSQC